MNYMAEIKLFYDWLETHPLTPASIALWHALMFIANRSGWKRDLEIPATLLVARSGIPRSTVYRERERLRAAGRLDFCTQGGRASCIYRLIPLETVSRRETQNDISASHSGTLGEQTAAFAPQIASHSGTTYKLDRDAIDTHSNPEKDVKERKNSAKKRERPFDAGELLATLEEPWQGLMRTWLEYKRTRRESYRSELGVKKCLSLLRELSAGNPRAASEIIDRSIANNWAGLFALQNGAGRRVGQIKQPASKEQEHRLLEKFGTKK